MPDPEESHLRKERRSKAERLRTRGHEPYPWAFPGRVMTATIVDACRGLAPGASAEEKSLRTAGRLLAIRSHGKTSFLDLEDASGPLQLLLRTDDLGEARYHEALGDLDPGDLIGADGVPLVTRRGEPSLRVTALHLLAKAIAPPPEKYHGLKDPEERIRRRYVDLLSSRETRRRFTARSLLLREVRHFLDGEGFLEVETPILTSVASGAAARTFDTRSNFLDQDLRLRVALELPLKRLLVGGLERVYEIGHVFRNEDMDSTHLPEFTMLELYWAYEDYHGMRDLVERLYSGLAQHLPKLLPDVPAALEAPALFTPPFARVDYVDELERLSGLTHVTQMDVATLRRHARAVGATIPDDSPAGAFLDKLFDHYVLPTLQRPTFVVDHPISTSPLAKRHRTREGRIERFELFCRGFELGNAYTELNDPEEQERRFLDQLSARGEDQYAYDADFVEALRYGMPPSTGLGIGIDRMVMALTGFTSIKDIVLFVPARERSEPKPSDAPAGPG
ncbi:MAG: lysine--tRNA ligase [Thermoplasmata archaeon]|nr:lysine--tRNA ligase [Thermoplasmata archaeon]